MPRPKKDEGFDKFMNFLEQKEDPIEWLEGKSSSKVYEWYKYCKGTNLSQKALSTRLSKIFGDTMYLKMQYNEKTMKTERMWTRK